MSSQNEKRMSLNVGTALVRFDGDLNDTTRSVRKTCKDEKREQENVVWCHRLIVIVLQPE
jgi:hypothetical protein